MLDPAVECETFSSFLVDLPQGTHAIVVRGAFSFADALGPASAAARVADELLVRAGGPRAELSFPDSGRAALEALAARARAQGRKGVLILVDADDSVAGSSAHAHQEVERALGSGSIPGARVVCVYGRTSEGPLLSAVRGEHALALGPEASAWP
jgi:hypothetical protein